MNSWNLSIPLTTAAEVSVIFFAAHARGYLLLFYLTVLCVGLRGGRDSLQLRPTLACLEWLTSIYLALVDRCLNFCISGLHQGAQCPHLTGNEA